MPRVMYGLGTELTGFRQGQWVRSVCGALTWERTRNRRRCTSQSSSKRREPLQTMDKTHCISPGRALPCVSLCISVRLGPICCVRILLSKHSYRLHQSFSAPLTSSLGFPGHSLFESHPFVPCSENQFGNMEAVLRCDVQQGKILFQDFLFESAENVSRNVWEGLKHLAGVKRVNITSFCSVNSLHRVLCTVGLFRLPCKFNDAES